MPIELKSKPTLATLKAFISKHRPVIGGLLIRQESHFDGMIDGIASTGQKLFAPLSDDERKVRMRPKDLGFDNDLGINGVWLVGSSRDRISAFRDDERKLAGYHVYNCCGSSTVAVVEEA